MYRNSIKIYKRKFYHEAFQNIVILASIVFKTTVIKSFCIIVHLFFSRITQDFLWNFCEIFIINYLIYSSELLV